MKSEWTQVYIVWHIEAETRWPTFSNAFSWMKMYRFTVIVPEGPINNIPALVQIMAWHFLCNKPLLEPMMVSLLTHICITRPQWVNRWTVWYWPLTTQIPYPHLANPGFAPIEAGFKIFIWEQWLLLSFNDNKKSAGYINKTYSTVDAITLESHLFCTNTLIWNIW